MFKRVGSFLLALALVLTLIPMSVFAAATAELLIANVEAKAGETVEIPVTVSGLSEVNVVNFYGKIDVAEGLTLKSVVAGDNLADFANGVSNLGFFQYDANDQWNGATIADGTIFTLTLEVNADATENTYPVSIAINTFADANLDDISYNVTDGGVTIPSDPTAYTATLTGQNVIVHVEDTFEIYLGADKDFAATEIELTYDTTLVEFVADENAAYSIKEIEAGKLKLADYGADKTAGEQIYALTFNAIAEGDAAFTVTKAGFGTGTSAEDKNLYEAALPEELIVPITVETHTVTLDKVDGKDIFDQTGEKIVESGDSFTFKPETSTGAYYNYDEITITMGESEVKATLQEDGSYVMSGDTDDLVVSYENGQWTIEEVTGDVTITGKRTAKSYGVKVEYYEYSPSGIGEQVTLPQDAPTYGEDYIFYLPEDRPATTYEVGYKYSATVTVNGVSVDCDVNVNEYTISGMDITGDVVITVTREDIPASGANMVSVEISGSDLEFDGISGTYASVYLGESITLVLTEQTGYTYTIKANGTDITTRFEDGKYTFNVNEDTVIEVIRDVDVTYAKAEQYVTMKDEKSMWIVMISPEEAGAQIAGKTYTFGGEQMLWSSKYNAYCILVIAETAPEMTGFEIISVAEIPEIAYNYDVNGSENATVDANDAQLVYNMYNATYEDFTSAVTMEKFFKADIITGATEGTSTYLGVTDAAAIIAAILDGTVN